MKIAAVRASWLRAVIPPERAQTSDFGRNDTFNTCLVEIETEAGLTGLGEIWSRNASISRTATWALPNGRASV